MKKREKQVQNKAGGKDFGTVRIINVFILLVFSIFLINCFSSKTKEPERVQGIPKSAKWHGGTDGGVWINIDTTGIINEFNIQCYFEDGDIREEGVFALDSLIVLRTFSIRELHKMIIGFDGMNLLLIPEMYERNPQVIFKKKKSL